MFIVFLHQTFLFLHILSKETFGIGKSVLQLGDLNLCDVFEHFLVLYWESFVLVIKLNSNGLCEHGGVTSERMHLVCGHPRLLIVLIDVLRKRDRAARAVSLATH